MEYLIKSLIFLVVVHSSCQQGFDILCRNPAGDQTLFNCLDRRLGLNISSTVRKCLGGLSIASGIRQNCENGKLTPKGNTCLELIHQDGSEKPGTTAAITFCGGTFAFRQNFKSGPERNVKTSNPGDIKAPGFVKNILKVIGVVKEATTENINIETTTEMPLE